MCLATSSFDRRRPRHALRLQRCAAHERLARHNLHATTTSTDRRDMPNATNPIVNPTHHVAIPNSHSRATIPPTNLTTIIRKHALRAPAKEEGLLSQRNEIRHLRAELHRAYHKNVVGKNQYINLCNRQWSLYRTISATWIWRVATRREHLSAMMRPTTVIAHDDA